MVALSMLVLSVSLTSRGGHWGAAFDGPVVPLLPRQMDGLSTGFEEASGCDHAGQSFIQASPPRGSTGDKDLLEDVHMEKSQNAQELNLHRTLSESKETPRQQLEKLHQQAKQDLDALPLAMVEHLGALPPPGNAVPDDNVSGDISDSGHNPSNGTVESPRFGWMLLQLVQAGRGGLTAKAQALHFALDSSAYKFLGICGALIILGLIGLMVMTMLDRGSSRRPPGLAGPIAQHTRAGPFAQQDLHQGDPPYNREKRHSPQPPPASPSATATAASAPQSQPALTGAYERREADVHSRSASSAELAKPPLPMLCEDLVVPPSAACTLLLPHGPLAATSSEVSVNNLEDQGVFHASFTLDPALGGAGVVTLSCCEQRHVSGELREIRYGVFASCRLSPSSGVATGVGDFQRNLPQATIHRQCEDNAFADLRSVEGNRSTFQLNSRSGGEMFFRAQREDGVDLLVTDGHGQTLAKVMNDPARSRRTVTVMPLVDAGLVVLTTLAIDWMR